MNRAKLFLIDGHAMCYRAYYAIRSLSNSKGEATNAIYGFVMSLRKLIAEHQPEYFAICFDSKEPTFRHERFKDYKAHRKPMPDDLIDQIEAIKEFCEISQLKVFAKPGFEADDLLGTLAVKGEEKGLEVFIATGDKDMFQLVTDQIKIWNPHKECVFDQAGVRKRYDGLGPEKVTEFMALTGDASDNIPGVRGIGEKTALKLIKRYGGLEKLYQNVDEIKSKSQKALLIEHESDAYESRDLVTIDRAVPLKLDWKELERKKPDEKKLYDFFQRYEFRGLLKNLTPSEPPKKEKRDYRVVSTKKDLDVFVKELKEVKAFSFDTETTSEDPMKADLVGMSFSWKEKEAYYLPASSVKHSGEGIDEEVLIKAIGPILENEKQKKFGQNLKYDWIVMKRLGVDIQGVAFDTMIASYLVNPLKFNHNLDDISLEYLGIQKIETASLIGKGKSRISMAEVPVKQVAEYACEDADCVFRLVPLLRKKLEERELVELFDITEVPLSIVLGKVEKNGVALDLKLLKKFSEEAGKDLEDLTAAIYEEAGAEFNINSPKQLSEILFERLQLPVIRRTKTGNSTDVRVLEKLAEEHEIPKKILEFREKSKLKSTYLDALPEMVNAVTDRVHTSYHQTTTATGRLSSSDPNLQNIPIKTESGRKIRKAFIANTKEKGKILSADYSQIELRVLGHLSGDKNLTKAFKEDRDIHSFTATLLYGVEEKDVTRAMRNLAKVINFSIIYGKTAFGLSQDLKISIPEADGFIKNYFKRYKGIQEYLEGQKEEAREKMYLTTILGRRSFFPDIHSRNMQVRQFAERAAINAPIQGSAADLIKLAMIRIQARLENEKFKTAMIMQVHDELVFDVPREEENSLEELVRREMEEAYPMSVPLKVDVFVGDSWYKN